MEEGAGLNFRRMFNCDAADVRVVNGTYFLILGWNRNTRQEMTAQWYKDGQPMHFDYVEQKVVASGRSLKELRASAREYKRLTQMTMEQYLKEVIR